MMATATPIADLIDDLLSQNVPRDQAVTAGRRLEEALAGASTGRGTKETKRERERIRKAAWRASRPRDTAGQTSLDISSTDSQQVQSIQKEESSKDSYVAVVDDWPSDFCERFWKAYIGPRKYDRPKVFAKLAKLRADKTVTWTALLAGLERYKATNPESKFIPAPMVWLNQHRWEADYGPNGGPNGTNPAGNTPRPSGGSDAFAAAVARRFGGGNRDGAASRPADPVRSAAGVDRGGASGGGAPAFDLDLKAGPAGAFRG